MTRLQEWLHLAQSVCLCVSLYSSDCRTVYVCMWCVYEWDWFHIARGAQVADGSIWPPPGFSWVVPVRHHRIPNPSRQHHILWSHWNCDVKTCYGHNIVKEALSQVDHPDYIDYLEDLDLFEHMHHLDPPAQLNHLHPDHLFRMTTSRKNVIQNGNVQNVGGKVLHCNLQNWHKKTFVSNNNLHNLQTDDPQRQVAKKLSMRTICKKGD